MSRIVVSLLIVALFVYVASPLLLPLAMGAVFAVLFFPLFELLERWKVSRAFASAMVTLSVTLLVILPAAALIFLGARAGLKQFRIWREAPIETEAGFAESLVNAPPVRGFLERVAGVFPIQMEELVYTVEDLIKGVGLKIGDVLAQLVTQLPGMTMGLAIMVISIYFFLYDGRRVAAFVRKNSVFRADETERLIHSFAAMCRSVMLATVASGFAQSIIFGLACVAVGLNAATLIGFVVFLASFIPLVGAAPVTFGVAIYQLVIADQTTGIILLVAAAVTSMVDNLIRPLVLRGAGNLHPLLAFVAAFGGLQILGFVGVFLGPIIAALFVVTVDNLTRSTLPRS